MSRSDPANDAWQEFKADHPEAEQHWVFMFAYRRGQEDAADAIQALHPGEVKNSVIFLRELAAGVGTNTGAADMEPEELVAILAKHRHNLGVCTCGYGEGRYWGIDERTHRAHVAQMVLESHWLAAVKAEAFKRGWIDSAVHHATCHECGTGPLRHDIPDPYRADRVDAEDTDNTTDRT